MVTYNHVWIMCPDCGMNCHIIYELSIDPIGEAKVRVVDDKCPACGGEPVKRSIERRSKDILGHNNNDS
jgi:hypothetical protein